MSRLLEYRSAIVSELKKELPEFRTVEPFPGVFNAAALSRFTVNAPAALVSLIRIKRTGRNNVGQLIGPVSSVVYVVARDPLSNQAWAPAIELAEKVADVIELNQFGLAYAGAALVSDIDVLYSVDVDSTGLAIAAVGFEQEITFGRDRNVDDEEHDEWLIEGADWPADVVGTDITRGDLE